MDATRTRRTKDPVRQQWYATSRQYRFTRHMFGPEAVSGHQLAAFSLRLAAVTDPSTPRKK